MALVDIKNVTKSYGSIEVLKGVSLSIDEGEIVTIIGKSGSGKSTLLRCINALERIDGGEITVEGQSVRTDMPNLRGFRQRVGIVFQAFNLFPHLTVERNITLAPILNKRIAKAEGRALALDVLARVGLADKIDAYPAQLSGGQQQRVAIARCLAMGPQLMLFDEVTSALDPELVGEVLKVMEDMARQGMTMVLVTHEMGFARNVASKIVFMHQGRVWEEGPPAELFANPRTPELRSFIASAR
ncbi:MULTISPECIES: amino acid ABC transporter ATP-binding protein [Azospirillum]|uniref:ATP-binding cassette domain-containing protein n=1 Tax=Azospirillum formosense TaxID=861533 RepID=A0ABX2KPZ5_9PROT|nr:MULTISPECIES: amino acid ABC transporter ATP-binding protein [Azospirillum]MBY3754410.1 amino acid ABC transporter ATP-binding protein [Azospirillum formosense]NUB18714.1 ATP-binding cassette domain-containing protein [Azospirillum formosense]NUB25632.1 ATP-binding cassette domain-containing protein [Azospirillum brasilense]NUB33614.1 ATP-binding cassette domain-containing protein [Azospirillum brasilense]RIW00365.1 amino acid ABC transporter ATP-binding protein [Azospirillum brasilense]